MPRNTKKNPEPSDEQPQDAEGNPVDPDTGEIAAPAPLDCDCTFSCAARLSADPKCCGECPNCAPAIEGEVVSEETDQPEQASFVPDANREYHDNLPVLEHAISPSGKLNVSFAIDGQRDWWGRLKTNRSTTIIFTGTGEGDAFEPIKSDGAIIGVRHVRKIKGHVFAVYETHMQVLHDYRQCLDTSLLDLEDFLRVLTGEDQEEIKWAITEGLPSTIAYVRETLKKDIPDAEANEDQAEDGPDAPGDDAAPEDAPAEEADADQPGAEAPGEPDPESPEGA